ncbi:hypothetical protein [Pseudomonas sp. LH1G9]|jgi:hypothetical protein|uniref:hypothetical protein n=1 Tax=Pseudomonas sp. LH1G9 TaxID=2083055 RepID=UPI000CF3349F|nr:hypothetical protein [Pseudomonas sp. LH1G9]
MAGCDSKIEAFNLNTTIEKTLSILSLLLYRLELKFDLSAHMAGIHQAIMDGTINAETIEQEEDNRNLQSKIKAPYKSHFHHACIYTELAKIKQGERDENTAWSFIVQANYQAGLTFGILSTYPGVDEEDVLSKLGRKATQARHSEYDPERREVIKLLSSPPSGGWKSEKEAFESIIEPLKSIINESLKTLGGKRFALTNIKKLEPAVKRWLSYDKKKREKGEPQIMVRQTYEKYSHETLSNPNNH